MEAAGREPARTGEAGDGIAVSRIAGRSGADRRRVPRRFWHAAEAGIAGYHVPLQSFGKAESQEGAKPKPAPAPETRPEPAAKPDPKLAGLQKQLASTNKKLEAAKAAGKPTRNLEDKIYEIDDAIRLATQP